MTTPLDHLDLTIVLTGLGFPIENLTQFRMGVSDGFENGVELMRYMKFTNAHYQKVYNAGLHIGAALAPQRNYQPCFRSVCITALNILDGTGISGNPKLYQELHTCWEDAGMGFDGFCGWIAEFAEHSEAKLMQRQPEDFPSVYDYDVSHSLGMKIVSYMKALKKLPDEDDVKEWLDTLIEEFFAPDPVKEA